MVPLQLSCQVRERWQTWPYRAKYIRLRQTLCVGSKKHQISPEYWFIGLLKRVKEKGEASQLHSDLNWKHPLKFVNASLTQHAGMRQPKYGWSNLTFLQWYKLLWKVVTKGGKILYCAMTSQELWQFCVSFWMPSHLSFVSPWFPNSHANSNTNNKQSVAWLPFLWCHSGTESHAESFQAFFPIFFSKAARQNWKAWGQC